MNVSELSGWENEWVEFRAGKVRKVFKPSLTLFIALKLRRATETDISDVELAIQKEGKERFDERTFRSLSSVKIIGNFIKLRLRLGL